MSLNPQNIGQFDKLATLRYPVPVRGSAGGVAWMWAAHGTRSWVKWLSQTGREFSVALARHSDLQGVVRLRRRSDIRSTWRILIDGVLYDVLSVLEFGRGYTDLSLKLTPNQSALTADYQVFEVTLDAGDVSKTVTYPSTFASSPTGVYVQLVIPDGGYTFTMAVVDVSRSATGFTIDFGAEVPGPGYKLSIQASL